MIAIFVQGAIYYGYKPDVSQEETEEFIMDYFLVEELPEALANIPNNHYATVAEIAGELIVTHIEIPVPEPQPPSRIEQLEAELLQTQLALTELAEASEQEKTEMQLALAELADIVTGGA